MGNLLTLSFWFSSRPGELLQASIIIFAILAVALLGAGVVTTSYLRKNPKSIYRKVLSRIQSFAFTNACINLLLLFFAYEAVPVLSMRFWFLVWFISMVAWGRVIHKDFSDIPQIKAKMEADRKYKQYIP